MSFQAERKRLCKRKTKRSASRAKDINRSIILPHFFVLQLVSVDVVLHCVYVRVCLSQNVDMSGWGRSHCCLDGAVVN